MENRMISITVDEFKNFVVSEDRVEQIKKLIIKEKYLVSKEELARILNIELEKEN